MGWHIEGGKTDNEFELYRDDWHMATIKDSGASGEPLELAEQIAAALNAADKTQRPR